MTKLGFEPWQDGSDLALNHYIGYLQEDLESETCSLLLLFPKLPGVAFGILSCLVTWTFFFSTRILMFEWVPLQALVMSLAQAQMLWLCGSHSHTKQLSPMKDHVKWLCPERSPVSALITLTP